jgi:hypothetical protein
VTREQRTSLSQERAEAFFRSLVSDGILKVYVLNIPGDRWHEYISTTYIMARIDGKTVEVGDGDCDSKETYRRVQDRIKELQEQVLFKER